MRILCVTRGVASSADALNKSDFAVEMVIISLVQRRSNVCRMCQQWDEPVLSNANGDRSCWNYK